MPTDSGVTVGRSSAARSCQVDTDNATAIHRLPATSRPRLQLLFIFVIALISLGPHVRYKTRVSGHCDSRIIVSGTLAGTAELDNTVEVRRV